MRPIEPVTTDEHGDEQHPAWGLINASRVSGTPGAVLFDSDLQHQHYVVVRISTATRRRNLNRDWVHPDQEFVEVAMSEAQWASFVSSMNAGTGIPCTIQRREDQYHVPGFPPEPRLAESMKEVANAADEAMETINKALAAYLEKKNAANLRTLEYAIKNAPANMTFAASSLTEHAENVVQRSRADIEAMVMAKADQLGVDAAEVVPQLLPGDDQGEQE